MVKIEELSFSENIVLKEEEIFDGVCDLCLKDISSYEKLKEHKKQVHEHGFKNSKNRVGAHKQKESLQSLNLSNAKNKRYKK